MNVCEPAFQKAEFFRSRFVSDVKRFEDVADVIVANRLSDELYDVKHKVYTRDLFGIDS